MLRLLGALVILVLGGCGAESVESQQHRGGSRSDAGSCAAIPQPTRELFSVLTAIGASNTFVGGQNPAAVGDHQSRYHGSLLANVWESCPDSGAELWVLGGGNESDVPETTRLIISLDEFFHDLDDAPQVDDFTVRITSRLSALSAAAPEAKVVIGNVPEPMMYAVPDTKALYNEAIADALNAAGYHVVDLDTFYDALMDARAVYDGDILTGQQVFVDMLHLSTLGHQVVADLFAQRLNELDASLAIPTHGNLELQ